MVRVGLRPPVNVYAEHVCGQCTYLYLFHSNLEHRASVMVRHLTLLAAMAFISPHDLLSSFTSLLSVLRHIVFGFPLFLLPYGFHSNVSFTLNFSGLRNTCPIHRHFRFLIPYSIGFWLHVFNISAFVSL